MDWRDTADYRFDSIFIGRVVDIDDPLRLKRVRVNVPGLLEPSSAWALPIGLSLGNGEGITRLPRLGANVMVFLNQGDPDYPCYIPGNFGIDEVPTHAAGDDVMSFDLGSLSITFDATAGSETLTVADRETGSSLVIDRATGGDIIVTSTTNLREVVNNSIQRSAQDESNVITALSSLMAGSREVTVSGSATEAVSGTKDVSAGSMALFGALALALSTGGPLTLSGASINLVSAGVTNSQSAGLVTETYLGGLVMSVTGSFTKTVSGLMSIVVDGLASISADAINLGRGPFDTLVKSVFLSKYDTHTHTDSVGGPTGPPLPAFQSNSTDSTANTKAS